MALSLTRKSVFNFLLTLTLSLSFTQISFAQNGLSSEQVSNIQSVGSVYLSADGNTAAYTLTVPADPFEENVAPSTHLYLMDVESEESRPFITGINVSGVAFRPDNNSITYLHKKEDDETQSLYEVSLEGGEPQKLFAFETNISGYEWAADGNHIVFRAEQPTEEADSLLPYSPELYEENLINTWAYIQNVAMEGHAPHRIPAAGSVYAAHWSPDQQKLAIAIAPTPLVDDFYMSQKVLVIDHESGLVQAEADHEGKLGQIAWSPDGEKLAIIAAANINDPIAGRLKIVNPETGEADLLMEDFKGMFGQVEWIDNNTLNYLASRGVWSEFGIINSDGTQGDVIVETGGPILKGFAHSNGTYVFDVSTPDHPDELYLMEENKNSPQRITNSNPWLDDVELSNQELFTYTTSDGFEIEGLLMYPLNYQEGMRYPLINVIHGGPEAHFSNGWLTSYSMPGQIAAGEDYVVFYPNYRGSTGRGMEFAMSSQGDLGGAEFDDIVEGVDHLIETGLVDEDKVGVTGSSYGGYATAWMSTYYSDRFAAGVMSVGVSNNLSKWGTSDIPEELYQVHARKRIWDDYQGYLERSPIYYADQAETPLLILHGKEDTRVDPGQSHELYRHIKTRTDTPVKLVLYPGEGHGNRRATSQFDFNLRMMHWFNQYLKGGDERPGTEIELKGMNIEN
ncbi:MAG: S9 family peptidase [Balneolaceae bacterium]